MKIRMGDVWDRTTAVIAARAGILTGIALLTIFLPTLVRDGWAAYAGVGVTAAVGRLVLGLLAFLIMLWGLLAIVAVSSDPQVGQSRALAEAGPRLLPTIAIMIVVGLALALAALPGAMLLHASGFDYTRAQTGLEQVNVSAGMLGGFALYMVLYGLVALWVTARLLALYPVIQNERRGFGAIGRSVALTRGSTWRIIGVIILYLIVLSVVMAAASSIVGVVARLLLGSEAAATVSFIVAIVVGIVTAVFTVLQTVFSTQFWAAATAAETGPATAPETVPAAA